MKIVITGGTGFIGQHTVRKLHEEGHDLLLLVRKKTEMFKDLDRITYTKCDISKSKTYQKRVEEFIPDAAIHLAWEGIPDWNSLELCIKNLNMSLTLMKTLAKIGCKTFISSGSCWEYGLDQGEMNEEKSIKEKNMYTATKHSFHIIGKQIAKQHSMKLTWLRIFYAYGPGQRCGALIPTLITALHKGEKPDIQNTRNKTDFVYVKDVANAFAMIIKKAETEGTFNIGSGKATSNYDIITKVYKACGKQVDISKTEPSPNDLNFWADISKIKQDVGWEPKTPLDEGIKQTIKQMIAAGKSRMQLN